VLSLDKPPVRAWKHGQSSCAGIDLSSQGHEIGLEDDGRRWAKESTQDKLHLDHGIMGIISSRET
tara:strand:- start:1051 stop:1245 length:195 start_codon:yes stop_codon:yes gene_type:complete